MAGRVLERKRGAGRPPGPRAPLPSVLHSTVGMLEASKRYYYTIRLFYRRGISMNTPLPRDFKDINCSTRGCTVYPRARNLNLFVFTCSIGFQPRYYYLFVDNIAITNKEINLEREILTVLLKFRMKLV